MPVSSPGVLLPQNPGNYNSQPPLHSSWGHGLTLAGDSHMACALEAQGWRDGDPGSLWPRVEGRGGEETWALSPLPFLVKYQKD